MGATVTTGKLACAFNAVNGQLVLVLFEETYEKNCHPHTPEWSCACMGTLEHVMRWIFLAGSHCEGGMLQSRSGHITPEGYITGWLKELANPVAMCDKSFELRVGDNFYATVPKGSLDKIVALLGTIGREDVAKHLESGIGLPVSLYQDAELLCALYKGHPVAPWRLFNRSSAPVHGPRDASLGYAPVSTKGAEMAVPAFLKLDRENRLIQRPDGSWYCGGWEYSIVSHFVANLWQEELNAPGSFRHRIKNYRDAVKGAQSMPDGMKVLVNLAAEVDGSYAREVLERLPQQVPGQHSDKGYEIVVTKDEDLLYKLAHLPEESVSWLLPAGVKPFGGEQLALM